MKSYIYCFAFVFLFNSCVTQSEKKVYDDSITIEHYDANNILKGLGMKDHLGNRQGGFTWYYLNGRDSVKYNYVNDSLDGMFTRFYPSGKIEQRGYYKNDKLDGSICFYKTNGKLDSRQKWKNGVHEYTSFFKNKKPFYQRAYFIPDGSIHSWVKFDRSGIILKSESRFPEILQYDNSNISVQLVGQSYDDSINVSILEDFSKMKIKREVLFKNTNVISIKLLDSDYSKDTLNILISSLEKQSLKKWDVEKFYIQLRRDEKPRIYNLKAIY